MLKESPYFIAREEDCVECTLCPHGCLIPARERGRCGVRINKNGQLLSETYGLVSRFKEYEVAQLPFQSFFPAQKALMVGSIGCNMKCPFCLTWEVSQAGAAVQTVTPEQLVEKAKTKNLNVLVFNLNEPTLWIEYIYSVFPPAQQAGISMVAISNGMINPVPLNRLLNCLSALCIDVKTWDNETCAGQWGGDLDAIKDTIIRAHKAIDNLSVSYLLIAQENDDKAQLQDFFTWLARLSRAIPLFLIPYQPAFYYEKPATSEVQLYQVKSLAQQYLDKVNVLTPYC